MIANFITRGASLTLLLAIGVACRAADVPSPPNRQAIVDSFLAAAARDGAHSPHRLQAAKEVVENLRSDPDAIAQSITEGLRQLYPAFGKALIALGDESLAVAVPELESLQTSNDPFLRADASYFLSRAYLLEERYEDSLPLLTKLNQDWRDKTLRNGEVLFMLGVTQMQLLKQQEAAESLQSFLAGYPQAPERMRIGAMQQLKRLRRHEAESLADVQMRMEFSRRRLALEDTSQITREQQAKIVDILARLIDEAQQREAEGSGSGKSKSRSQGVEGDNQASGAGRGSQQGKTDRGRTGVNDTVTKRLHRGGPQSPWSKLRDKDRDPAFNAIKQNFPGRYQQLIEQYYKSFQDESES